MLLPCTSLAWRPCKPLGSYVSFQIDQETAGGCAVSCVAGMPDIERLNRKLESQRASLADLCQLYRASSALPRLEEALRCHEVMQTRAVNRIYFLHSSSDSLLTQQECCWL